MDTSPDSRIGTILNGTYELQRVIGKGAFGTVYAARHVRLSRQVALKLLHAHDAAAFERFRREAEVTSSLGSRYIAQVFDFDATDGGIPYLVMEYLEGEDLWTRLQRQKRITPAAALKIAEQVAVALSVAHRHQIVHRDLKPQNIFLARSEDEGEIVKVIDFGISKVLADPRSTRDGEVIGTPLYMSPEQVRGRGELIDARTDIYALAAVLYEAISGTPPYLGDTIYEIGARIMGPEPPAPLHTIDPDLPPAVDAALQRALAKDRDARPRSVGDFFTELEAAIRGEASGPVTPGEAIGGTQGVNTAYITGMVAAPLWRGAGARDHELRFTPPERGFSGGDTRPRSLTFGAGARTFYIGSVAAWEGVTNDLILPHPQVSRHAVAVTARDGRVWFKRMARCSVPVRVGLTLLERDEERALHHGQALAIGVIAGVFLDGRYVPAQVPAGAIDELTGLLARDGLAWELALAERIGEPLRLVVMRAVEEPAAARAALALHGMNPIWPVARFDVHAAALVGPGLDVGTLVSGASAAAGARLASSHEDLLGPADRGAATVDAARAVLENLARKSVVS